MESFEAPRSAEKKQESPKELGDKFFEQEDAGVMSKIKEVLNILKPQELRDGMYKLSGALSFAAGLEMSRVAFLNPEQMNILGNELTSGTLSAARLLAVCSTLAGGMLFAAGISEAVSTIKRRKAYEIKK